MISSDESACHPFPIYLTTKYSYSALQCAFKAGAGNGGGGKPGGRPMNRNWHEQHQLSRAASSDDRVKWHVEHAKVCGCRPIPARVLEEIERRGISATG